MLPLDYRLRANRDFRVVYARGRSATNAIVALHQLRGPGGTAPHCARVGFVVSKKHGGAVVRNRIKRRLREAMRRRLSDLRAVPVDLVFVARSGAKAAAWTEMVRAVDDLLRRGGLLRESNDRPAAGEPDGAVADQGG
ncbi:MAG TPA: ribonuclease P protein component [Chthonomonadaceae bacterium]|nr:ribonuclease P protein component [Chthonomonadaceae bacterium]